MERCRLTASYIHVGVPLPGAVYDEPGNLLLNKGYVIKQPEQMEALLSRGMYVDVEQFNTIFRPASVGSGDSSVGQLSPYLKAARRRLSTNFSNV